MSGLYYAFQLPSWSVAAMMLCLEDGDRKLYLDDAQREGCVGLLTAPYTLSAVFEPIPIPLEPRPGKSPVKTWRDSPWRTGKPAAPPNRTEVTR